MWWWWSCPVTRDGWGRSGRTHKNRRDTGYRSGTADGDGNKLPPLTPSPSISPTGVRYGGYTSTTSCSTRVGPDETSGVAGLDGYPTSTRTVVPDTPYPGQELSTPDPAPDWGSSS